MEEKQERESTHYNDLKSERFKKTKKKRKKTEIVFRKERRICYIDRQRKKN